jgi:archaemetzincin
MKIKYFQFFLVLLGVIVVGISSHAGQWRYLAVKRKQVIYLTTMGSISSNKASLAAKEIERFYGIEVIYIGYSKLPGSAYCKVRNRYVAVEILRQLRKLQIDGSAPNDYKVLVLTDKDIETENGKHWGVMGLAFLGGDASIVSTYRSNGSYDRFRKVTLHEIGHMLGIDHCEFDQSNCLMNDAKGKGATVDKAKVFICAGCRKKIVV